MKKALVNDWYVVNAGGEKVIHSINNIWDDLEHYALVDFLNDEDRQFILKGKKVKTSFIQKFPLVKRNHRKYLQFFPMAIESFDLRKYDLIISTSSSVSKGALTNNNQLHICYCHSPMRYAWDLYHQYLDEENLNKGIKAWYAKYVLHKIRIWDVSTINRVDHFIANSNYIAARIKKIYNREATVIYPPVDTDFFELETQKENFFFTASRMVSYKKMQTIVEAFNEMPNFQLVVGGTGPEYNKIKSIAKSNIKILGYLKKDELKKYMQKAKAFVFAAEEDFGIISVEAQSCGTPIIAFGKGGALETVVQGETGLFFYEQTKSAIIDSVFKFEKESFNANIIRSNALKFSKQNFEIKMKQFVEEKYMKFKENL